MVCLNILEFLLGHNEMQRAQCRKLVAIKCVIKTKQVLRESSEMNQTHII